MKHKDVSLFQTCKLKSKLLSLKSIPCFTDRELRGNHMVLAQQRETAHGQTS